MFSAGLNKNSHFPSVIPCRTSSKGLQLHDKPHNPRKTLPKYVIPGRKCNVTTRVAKGVENVLSRIRLSRDLIGWERSRDILPSSFKSPQSASTRTLLRGILKPLKPQTIVAPLVRGGNVNYHHLALWRENLNADWETTSVLITRNVFKKEDRSSIWKLIIIIIIIIVFIIFIIIIIIITILIIIITTIFFFLWYDSIGFPAQFHLFATQIY